MSYPETMRETPSLANRARSCGGQLAMMGLFVAMLLGTGAFWVLVAGQDIPALGLDGGASSKSGSSGAGRPSDGGAKNGGRSGKGGRR